MDIKQVTEEVERVSQTYTEKFDIERDATWFVLKLQEEVGELIQSYLMLAGKPRSSLHYITSSASASGMGGCGVCGSVWYQ